MSHKTYAFAVEPNEKKDNYIAFMHRQSDDPLARRIYEITGYTSSYSKECGDGQIRLLSRHEINDAYNSTRDHIPELFVEQNFLRQCFGFEKIYLYFENLYPDIHSLDMRQYPTLVAKAMALVKEYAEGSVRWDVTNQRPAWISELQAVLDKTKL